jgi:hemoglobin-like flavoprotein
MTPEQVIKVQDSFTHLTQSGAAVADVFYTQLFTIDPGLRVLFKSDLTAQGHMLINSLAYVVENLHVSERIVPTMQALGIRHTGYGVTRAHYAVVGQALIATLAQTLDDRFDMATREAWMAAYDLLTSVMCSAAYDKEPGRAVFI